MTKCSCALLSVVVSLGLVGEAAFAQRRQTPSPMTSHVPSARPKPSSELIEQYCVGCHNDKLKTGGLSLAAFDAARPHTNADVAEKVVRKLRAGMMPPPGVRRPAAAATAALADVLESRIDEMAAARPNPGWRPFQRLNRAEYALAVRELLDIDVDVNAFLPPDTISEGFDNIADSQVFSPTLLEGYLRAAAKISSLAAGDRTAGPSSVTYKVPRNASQWRHVEGAPLGTRGGISIVHIFPADGEYIFRMLMHGGPTGQLFGNAIAQLADRSGSKTLPEQIEVSINGERVALIDINPRLNEGDPTGLWVQTGPTHVKAGPQRVSAAFIQRFEAPLDDLMAPIEYTLAETTIGNATGGVTTLPHLRDFTVSGPHRVTGVSDTPSRRKIFTCRPTTASEEAACAAEIVKQLAKQAYRRPVTGDDLKGLMAFYDDGRKEGDFETGIRMALQAILASPHFLFRFEQAPSTATIRAGQKYRISDVELASRLSFFLWGTVPDAELVKLAMQGTLRAPGVLEKQVRRMLADPRSEAMATRFAAQWLRLQDVDKIFPDAVFYPYYDRTLSESFKRETELFFDSLVRDDRSVLDLLTADYTLANERVAKHYGIPNVIGNAFRRVQIPDPNRRGILGHGSVLLLTSVADRTSPVLRGKWVMEVLLGSPPPPPPPNVPELEQTKSVQGGKLLSVRERMEEHRSNPTCKSCHRLMDPIGLALENFDVTGAWRIKDSGVPIDAAGELYDGSTIDGPSGLRTALLNRSDSVLRNFAENLMAYALGRRTESYDMPAVRAIVREAALNNHRISSYILGVVKSAAFQMSKVEPIETTVASQP